MKLYIGEKCCTYSVSKVNQSQNSNKSAITIEDGGAATSVIVLRLSGKSKLVTDDQKKEVRKVLKQISTSSVIESYY